MPDTNALNAYCGREAWFEGGERGRYESYDAQTAHVLPFFEKLLDDLGGHGEGRSLLDVGCGYGSHLAIAQQRGWECFGVELSDHARKMIHQRHGRKLFVVESVEDLVPHEFDVILMLDVLEHLPDPKVLFFTLFAKGAITSKTRIVIATPNARSQSAMRDPAGWPCRHPPSHLVCFSGESLRKLLKTLRFQQIDVRGWIEETGEPAAQFEDERSALNARLSMFGGLICEASGSDFLEFMHERYVPRTWSKLAEYEHIPRYLYAQALARDRRVLDFGCGTGYGSAMLARTAGSVVGIDIDTSALGWARAHHRLPHLSFECRDDLGAGLPADSFDLITCFEMIEHIPEVLQEQLVESLERLLADGGLAVISTPNPEVTKRYGPNPYHLREMTEAEFVELLKRSFPHVRLLQQWVQPGILLASAGDEAERVPVMALDPSGRAALPEPAAFIAVCSSQPIPGFEGRCFLDFDVDYIAAELGWGKRFNRASFDHYLAHREAESLRSQRDASTRHLEEQSSIIETLRSETKAAGALVEVLRAQNASLEAAASASKQRAADVAAALQDSELSLNAVLASRWMRLGNALKERPMSLALLRRQLRLVGSLLLPAPIERLLRPLVNRRRSAEPDRATKGPGFEPYVVKVPAPAGEPRPRIVHAIANFMTGGSSQLVVDLIERLGQNYDQRVLTSYKPDPECYLNVPLTELRQGTTVGEIAAFFRHTAPDLVHVHYWGDCDEPWYRAVFCAADDADVCVIENVNTPVAPYRTPRVKRYVFVSDYVKKTFGAGLNAPSVRVFPGSDFKMFSRETPDAAPDDCIGMVYRLETDKLNESSIEPFIKAVQRRPATRALIVGGGSLLEPFRNAVAAAGVSDAFTFTEYVAYGQLPHLYAKMSVFVAPVWKESFGQVSPFAMSMGIPVVGYGVGAIPEIVGDPSLCAPYGDSEGLANMIVRLLDDRPRRIRIGERNRERAHTHFTIEAMIDAYSRLYGELLGAKR